MSSPRTLVVDDEAELRELIKLLRVSSAAAAVAAPAAAEQMTRAPGAAELPGDTHPGRERLRQVARVLQEKGFIKKFVVVEDGKQGLIKLLLRYTEGVPAIMPLNKVIRCWTQALQHMQVGGKVTLSCPAEMSYGSEGLGNVIPPNTPLTFDIELLGIER